jgi:outer membrane receptor protein involved in Fe transport
MIRYQRVNTGSLAPFNVASSRVQGIELWTMLDGFGHVRAETALTVLDPRETTDDPVADPTPNDILPLTSRFVASSYLEAYLAPEHGALSRLALGVRHSHRASRYQDPAGLSVLPAQDFFDLEASAQLFAGVLAWRAALRNVFDARAVDLVGFPLPGRTFHLLGELWL